MTTGLSPFPLKQTNPDVKVSIDKGSNILRTTYGGAQS
jgi:hypothetical protein